MPEPAKTSLEWDKVGERYYETGVDHGVLFVQNTDNAAYDDGEAWNGLTAVTQSPSGAEASPQYADNMKYLNLMSNEEFGGTIEAFYSPEKFDECDGSKSPVAGVTLGQQNRKQFGLSYRTKIGNDTEGQDHGYKLHLVWNALASPSERNYQTINDSPEATPLSWEFTTTPMNVKEPGYKPCAHMEIDTTKLDANGIKNLKTLEAKLYGESGKPTLPTPDEVIAIMKTQNSDMGG